MPRKNDPAIPGTTLSVRVPDDIAAEVALVARIEGVNVSEVIVRLADALEVLCATCFTKSSDGRAR